MVHACKFNIGKRLDLSALGAAEKTQCLECSPKTSQEPRLSAWALMSLSRLVTIIVDKVQGFHSEILF